MSDRPHPAAARMADIAPFHVMELMARAQALEKLGAAECPRCAMRLACRFRVGGAP